MAIHSNLEVRWRNLRSHEDTLWLDIRPLTILLGPNNSGKSSVIAPLLMLNQTLASRDGKTPLITSGGLTDLGAYDDLIIDGLGQRDLTLEIKYHTHKTPRRPRKVGKFPPGILSLRFGQREGAVRLVEQRICDIYGSEFLTLKLGKTGYNLTGKLFLGMSNAERSAIRRSRLVNFLFSPASILDKLDGSQDQDARSGVQDFSPQFNLFLRVIGTVFSDVRSFFDSLSYVGPLRDRARRYYEVSAESPISVGPRGANAAQLLFARQAGMGSKLNSWIRRLDLGDQIKARKLTKGLFDVEFKVSGIWRNMADMGFGASQTLPLVVQALLSPRGSLTVAEQPEIHLNPRLQSVLGDLFVEMACNDRRILVETHSEHLLLRVRNLVARGEIDSEMVAIYFVEKRDSRSIVRRIPIDRSGHITVDDWPAGFFDENLRGSLALANSQLIRRAK